MRAADAVIDCDDGVGRGVAAWPLVCEGTVRGQLTGTGRPGTATAGGDSLRRVRGHLDRGGGSCGAIPVGV